MPSPRQLNDRAPWLRDCYSRTPMCYPLLHWATTATLKNGYVSGWWTQTILTNRREEKVGKELIEIISNQREGDGIRVTKSEATKKGAQVRHRYLRKKPVTLRKSYLDRDFCQPTSKCLLPRTGRGFSQLGAAKSILVFIISSTHFFQGNTLEIGNVQINKNGNEYNCSFCSCIVTEFFWRFYCGKVRKYFHSLWGLIVQFSSVQLLCCVWLFATPWITARQASLSITTSRSLLKLMSIESVTPSSHLILCRPLLLLPPTPPSIRVFSNEFEGLIGDY